MVRLMVRLMAPVISFTADEIWQHMPQWQGKEESVHLASFPAEFKFVEPVAEARWEKLREVRDLALKALEEARADKLIGQGLDAKLVLTVDAASKPVLEHFAAELPQLFIVSQVEISDGDSLAVTVEKAEGGKCERCWTWSTWVGSDAEHPTTCQRCADVLKSL